MTLGIRGVDHIFLNTNEIEVVEDIDNFLGSKAVNASIDEMLQDQKIHIGLSKESDLGLIRYKEIWVKWIDSQEINSDEFMSGEGKGIFVVSDELFDSEKLLNLLDRDNILGIIFSASLDQSLRHEIDSRRIPCFQMLQGQSLILETDGKSVWVRR
jgi:hypothetical protein